MRHLTSLILLVTLLTSCRTQSAEKHSDEAKIQVGAERFEKYMHLLNGKSVGMVVNQTSMVGDQHLVDTLISLGIQIEVIFAPEHGFRGEADAGESISDSRDQKTGIPIVSIYGKNKKPSPEHLESVDVMVFDIQDVGTRFYTYISSMHYVMEACAEQGIPFLVLDRPNPNGHYVDGPVLEKGYESFVGLHPIPVVHGMTVGELAQMINQEGWLMDSVKANLNVIGMRGWSHDMAYELPVKPSPNLPNQQSIRLYPSLCFFEGTNISVGRGTDFPFQVIGYPDSLFGTFTFTPESNPGSKYPKHEDETCFGLDLRTDRVYDRLDLSYLMDFFKLSQTKKEYFNNYFDKLAGNSWLREWIFEGKSEEEIRQRWKEDLEAFKKIRSTYLLYKESNLNHSSDTD